MRPRKVKAAWLLSLLLAANTLNFFDRQLLGVVAESVRKEWSLNDTALGGLGTAFVILYAAVGVPLGRLADQWSRVRLLSLGVLTWSLMTMLSGLAGSYWTLLAARFGVGVGEAVCAPCAASLIGDAYMARRRGRALAIFMLGLPIGLSLSSALGGMIAQRYGWRMSFLAAAWPGFLLAALFYLVQEPARGELDGVADLNAADRASPMAQVMRIPTMWWVIASGALHNFNLYSLSLFLPAFLIRYHGISLPQANFLAALAFGGAGAAGMFLGGLLSDRAVRTAPNGRMRVAATASVFTIPCLALALLQPQGSVTVFFLGLWLAVLSMYVYYASVYATIQDVVAPEMRGTGMALYFFAMYLLGGALGTIGTGRISDVLARRAATRMGSVTISETAKAIGLHHAMWIIPVLCAPLALVLFLGARTVAADMENVHRRGGSYET
ncbi:MAG: MFS transporter [Acidobacteria bacterium]|nr:MFS transporter [Acidobacteriota bacterium]